MDEYQHILHHIQKFHSQEKNYFLNNKDKLIDFSKDSFYEIEDNYNVNIKFSGGSYYFDKFLIPHYSDNILTIEVNILMNVTSEVSTLKFFKDIINCIDQFTSLSDMRISYLRTSINETSISKYRSRTDHIIKNKKSWKSNLMDVDSILTPRDALKMDIFFESPSPVVKKSLISKFKELII